MIRRKIDIREYAREDGKATPDWSSTGEKETIYFVPIDKLYYNDTNGRIATYISGYNDESEVGLDSLPLDEYNDKIEGFIKSSSSESSFKKTYEDIKLKGQIQPGVILEDGRVVSGNRRFTILRNLYRDTSNDKYAYFKCYIKKFPNNEDEEKSIKTIERLTQFGVDEKVDYDPISRLVDIYNDLLGPSKLWSEDEYIKKLSLKPKDVRLMLNKAKIMVDYLDYKNISLKFHIAKAKKLDGPLQELAAIYQKVSNDEWNRIRVLLYSEVDKDGDRTRNIRKIIKMYNNDSEKFENLLELCVNDIQEYEIKNLNSRLEIKEENNIEYNAGNMISNSTNKEIFKTINQYEVEEKRQKKVEKIFKAFRILYEIDTIYNEMTFKEKEDLKFEIENFVNNINKIGFKKNESE